MPTVRLTPSAYTLSNTSYLSVSSASNMYNDTDNTTYATVTNSRTSTTSYYIYLHDFNISDIPSAAVVTSFSVKLKARESGVSTSSSYRPYLVTNGSTSTSTYYGYCDALGTSVATKTFTLSCDWNDIVSEGNDFSIRINCRRASRNTTSYVYIYGAEIEVTYTVPNPRTITTSLVGSGTISPSGSTTSYDGEEFELTITPTNISAAVTVTNNNVDVTSELVEHYSGGTPASTSSASGSGVTTGFSRSNGAFYQSSSTSSDAWLRYAIGHTAESPYSTSNTNNTYVKDGTNDANTMGWMNYPFVFSDLPEDAEITSVQVKCYGAAESTSETARHADVELYCGNELKSVRQSFTSTSNGTITISSPGEWTRDELQNAWVRFIVGYYGGRILGITWTVNYTHGGTLDHYTYTYEVDGDANIVVNIGGAVITKTFYQKKNNAWSALNVTTVYKKVNGSWVQQSAWENVFDPNTTYVYISN